MTVLFRCYRTYLLVSVQEKEIVLAELHHLDDCLKVAFEGVRLRVEDVDTAEVAERISKKQLKNVAAIAPKIAADLFDLEVIEDEIQTIKNNATRFVIVRKNASTDKQNATEAETLEAEGVNKASLKFELDHKRGSPAAMLNVMSDCKLNLTKIQSLPKIETPWKYAFFVLFTFQFIGYVVKLVTSHMSHITFTIISINTGCTF